ncbi:MAG: helix-turn-helix domain-containing protein [Muribaculaceae bacterium]|nr:helix-turn-helix domain-containing protein [Muribaculaceae bacterium]
MPRKSRNFVLMELHQVVNSIAAFSFLTSAGFMSMIKIQHLPEWKHVRRCRVFMSLIFAAVGVSCLKTVLFNLPARPEIIQTSTIISGSLQALLFYCTGMSLMSPDSLHRKTVTVILCALLANAVQMIGALLMFPDKFIMSLVVSLVLYGSLMAYYIVNFRVRYKNLVKVTDEITDEDSAYNYRWIKRFLCSVTLLGISVCVVVFAPVAVYDLWMIIAALFYCYVTLCFVNYCNYNMMIVRRVEEGNAQDVEVAEDDGQLDVLERNLAQWVEKKGFVKNDLVSEELASEMGVSLSAFRLYFKDRHDTDFRSWRTKLRIEYACEIIAQHPGYPMGTVGEMVGIADRSNFNKAFVKIKGVTPKEYSRHLAD